MLIYVQVHCECNWMILNKKKNKWIYLNCEQCKKWLERDLTTQKE